MKLDTRERVPPVPRSSESSGQGANPYAIGANLLGTMSLIFALIFPLLVTNPSHQNFAILVLMFAQLGVAWNILVGMMVGALLSTCFALAVGWPCFRLKGHYFAMATIAVGEIMQVIFTNWDLVGGAVGLSIPMQEEGWAVFVFKASKLPYYYIILSLLLVTLLANRLIEKSYLGYYFRAIKDDPDAARSLGVSLTRYKLLAIAASSFLTALGGTFYAQKELFIDPASTMATALSVKMALAPILGGVGSLFGPVVGAFILTGIEEASRIFFGGSGRGTDLIIYASLIIGVAVFYPSGIVGAYRKLAAGWSLHQRWSKSAVVEPADSAEKAKSAS